MKPKKAKHGIGSSVPYPKALICGDPPVKAPRCSMSAIDALKPLADKATMAKNAMYRPRAVVAKNVADPIKPANLDQVLHKQRSQEHKSARIAATNKVSAITSPAGVEFGGLEDADYSQDKVKFAQAMFFKAMAEVTEMQTKLHSTARPPSAKTTRPSASQSVQLANVPQNVHQAGVDTDPKFLAPISVPYNWTVKHEAGKCDTSKKSRSSLPSPIKKSATKAKSAKYSPT